MRIKIRQKNLKAGRMSLYLDIHWNGRRWKEFLGIWLENPTNAAVQKENALKMQTAMRLCEERRVSLLMQESQAISSVLLVSDFLKVFDEFVSSYTRKDLKVVKAVASYLSHYAVDADVLNRVLDKSVCEEFLFYLSDSLHGNTPVGYFKKFKMCLAQCVEKGLLLKNPANGIRLTTSEEITKDILDCSEIQLLADTPMPNEEVKRAFLFACYTGLRWCDVVALKYKSVDFSRNMLVVCQRKVMSHSSKAVLHLNLNKTAMNLLQRHTGEADYKVFQLPSYSYARRLLIDWAARAGIQKHITFHCARHSFVTNLMLGGANIKTASILAGHSTIRHTEKYVHIIDEVKQRAVDSLPDLELKSGSDE